MVEKFIELGFEVTARGWFQVCLQKGDWSIYLKENSADVMLEKGTAMYFSDTFKPTDLYTIFSEHRESEIKLELLPF